MEERLRPVAQTGLEENEESLLAEIEREIERNPEWDRKKFTIVIESIKGFADGAVIRCKEGNISIQGFLPMSRVVDVKTASMSLNAVTAWLSKQQGRIFSGYPIDVHRGKSVIPEPVFALDLPITPDLFKEQSVFEAEIRRRNRRNEIDNFLRWLCQGALSDKHWIRSYLIQLHEEDSQWRDLQKGLQEGQRFEIVRWLAETHSGEDDFRRTLFTMFQEIAATGNVEFSRTRIYAVKGMERLAQTSEEIAQTKERIKHLEEALPKNYPDHREKILEALGFIKADLGTKESLVLYGVPLLKQIEEAIRDSRQIPVTIEAVQPDKSGAIVRYQSGNISITGFLPMSRIFPGQPWEMSLDARYVWLGGHLGETFQVLPLEIRTTGRRIANPIFSLPIPVTVDVFSDLKVFKAELGSRVKAGRIGLFLSWLSSHGANPSHRLIQSQREDAEWWNSLLHSQKQEIAHWLFRRLGKRSETTTGLEEPVSEKAVVSQGAWDWMA